MKRTIGIGAAILGLGVFCGAVLQTTKQPAQSSGTPQESAAAAPAAAPRTGAARRVEAMPAQQRPAQEPPVALPGKSPGPATTPVLAPAASGPTEVGTTPQIAFNRAIESIASPDAPHEARVAGWKQLRESGWLDQAIGTLEQQALDHPDVASYPAALGQAYLEKCGTIQDVREQGILAMKADQVFDAALSVDPGNWEARYTKALAMSYWPTQMNRGTEVMQHFVTLVEQQEAQAPQPHYAETYVRLGDEYLKYGHRDHALEIWQRGAARFPDDAALQAKLSAP